MAESNLPVRFYHHQQRPRNAAEAIAELHRLSIRISDQALDLTQDLIAQDEAAWQRQQRLCDTTIEFEEAFHEFGPMLKAEAQEHYWRGYVTGLRRCGSEELASEHEPAERAAVFLEIEEFLSEYRNPPVE